MIDSIGRISKDAFHDLVRRQATCNDYLMSTRPPCGCHIAFGAHRTDHKHSCVPGEGDGALPNGPSSTLHKHSVPVHQAGDVYSAMRSDAGDSQARPLLERDPIPQGDRLFSWDHNKLRRRAEGTITLRTETPHALAYA